VNDNERIFQNADRRKNRDRRAAVRDPAHGAVEISFDFPAPAVIAAELIETSVTAAIFPVVLRVHFNPVMGSPAASCSKRISMASIIPEGVSDWCQTRPESNLIATHQTQHHPTEMELHHCTKSVKLILRRPLAEGVPVEEWPYWKE